MKLNLHNHIYTISVITTHNTDESSLYNWKTWIYPKKQASGFSPYSQGILQMDTLFGSLRSHQ